MGGWVALVMGILFLFCGCFGLLVALIVGALIGSVLLRGAVALANRVLGPEVPPDTFGQWDDWDTGEPGPRGRAGTGRAIPEPTLTIGMVISLALGVVAFVGYVALGFVLGEVFDDHPDGWVAFVLLTVLLAPFTATALTVLVKLLLPTTFKRAAVVAFLHHFLAVVGAAGMAAFAAFVWALLVG